VSEGSVAKAVKEVLSLLPGLKAGVITGVRFWAGSIIELLF